MLPLNLRRVAVALVAIGAIAMALAFAMRSGGRLVDDPEDFEAFYCAGKVAVAGANPYRAEPLRSCEHDAMRASGFSPIPYLALPAPLPGYAIAFFGLFSRMTFSAASTAYLMLSLASVVATVLLLHRLTGFPFIAVMAAFALSVAQISVLNGQIVPIVVLALVASATALAGRHPALAALATAVATIEPHVALPACLSLAFFVPRSRIALAAGGAVAIASAVLALGVAPNVEYVLRVLPAHARAEVASPLQYSMTSMLYRIGVGTNVAVWCGSLSYAATCAIGLLVARRLARLLDAPELLVLVPPAFAVVGGPFVHLTQIAVAIPALLVLSAKSTAARRILAPTVVVLAVPWQDMAINDSAPVLLATGIVASAITALIWKPLRWKALGFVTAAIALAAAERYSASVTHLVRSNATLPIAAVRDGNRLAEASWAAFSQNALRVSSPYYYLEQIPTLLALTVFVAYAISTLRGNDRGPRLVSESREHR